MKSLLATSIMVPMWQSPVVALLLLVALVFITDLLNRYLENKKITCATTDFSVWSYRDVQLVAIANNIRGNQKKAVLIEGLNSI